MPITRTPIREGKSFPRDGNESYENNSNAKASKRKIDDPLATEMSPGKKVKKDLILQESMKVNDLSQEKLSEGMIIFGCIQEVHGTFMKINLPGQVLGYVAASNISEEYNASITQSLSGEEKVSNDLTQLFKPGQHVITKIEEITKKENGKLRVILSLKPNFIYDDISVSDIRCGFILSASVQSIKGKGYKMNCGIPDVTAFLKKSQAANFEQVWNDGRRLEIGQVIRCLAAKIKTSEERSNLKLDADPEIVANQIVEEIDVPVKSLFIGMLLNMTVFKVTSSGLVVKILENKTGYVHSNYVRMNFKTLNIGDTLLGRVLYVEPLTEKIYLTALENACGPFPRCPIKNIQKGHIFREAKVVSSKEGNILLELAENSKMYGYVTTQNLDDNIENEHKISETVKERYPKGSFHACKVLWYDYMVEKYCCSLKSSVMKQEISNVSEITPGIVMECKVIKSTEKKIILKGDNLKGFVKPIHCSDEPVRHPQKLLLKGQNVRAKVLAVKNSLCEFTLKSTLVHSQNQILTKFTDAKCDIPYDGVVMSVTEKGILVKFYGDFETFIPANEVSDVKTSNLVNLYQIGQVVTCYVKEIHNDEGKLVFTIQPHVKSETKKEDCLQQNSNSLKVGKPYVVYVDDISPEGLIVQERVSGIKGWIPATQLTDYPPMAKALCQTYRKGNEICTYCLSCANKVLFTRSPTIIKYFKSSLGKLLTKRGRSELKKNMVVPCTVMEITATGIVVLIHMQGETCLVNVASDDLCDGKVDVFSLGLEMYQSLMVQILQVPREDPLSGSCCFSRVTKGTLMSESGLMHLQHYMNCQKKICNFWKSEGHPIGEICVGSEVKGTVVAESSLGAVINLDNGIQAVVMPAHYKSLNLKKDMPVAGIVMFVDVVNKCVEISLEREVQDIFSSLGKFPDVGCNSKCYVLVSRPDVTVCSITCSKGKQIVYVPSRWHINDLHPSPYLNVGDHNKITIRIIDGGLIFAVPQELEILESNNENDNELIMNGEDYAENDYQKIDDRGCNLDCADKKKKKRKRKIEVMEEDTKQENDCPESKIIETSNNVLPDVKENQMNRHESFSEYTKSKTIEKGNSRDTDICENLTTEIKNKKEKRKNNTKSEKEKAVSLSPNINESPKRFVHSSEGNQDRKRIFSQQEESSQNRSNCKNSKTEMPKKEREKNSSEEEQTTYLDVKAGFVWNATPDLLPVIAKQKTQDDSSSDEETEVTVNKKKKQRMSMAEKRELARQEEERLRKIEERLMNAEKNPVSADDFDRLVMSAPNDSKNWIKYMAYHLEATEVGKARAVAERALKTISFREEQEKFNVWMALLNLENLYGTQESIEKTIEEAAKLNDSYKVHMQVLNMFSMTKKLEELDKLVQLVTKKYKDQKNTWVEAGLACMKCGEIEKSRQLMQRALKVLNKRDHIEILTRFARMENEWGESERAETIMENILTSYPKRVDVWMVYIDMLIKSKKIDIARQVLDRAVIQKLPVMKMKALFKKYLQFEQTHGTPDNIQKVREMAKNYVENYKS